MKSEFYSLEDIRKRIVNDINNNYDIKLEDTSVRLSAIFKTYYDSTSIQFYLINDEINLNKCLIETGNITYQNMKTFTTKPSTEILSEQQRKRLLII